jgi:hypothetical protein
MPLNAPLEMIFLDDHTADRPEQAEHALVPARD